MFWETEKDRQLKELAGELETKQATIRSLEGRLADASATIDRSAMTGKVLADELRDLTRKHQLLESVLKQLQVVVKLPARKQ